MGLGLGLRLGLGFELEFEFEFEFEDDEEVDDVGEVEAADELVVVVEDVVVSVVGLGWLGAIERSELADGAPPATAAVAASGAAGGGRQEGDADADGLLLLGSGGCGAGPAAVRSAVSLVVGAGVGVMRARVDRLWKREDRSVMLDRFLAGQAATRRVSQSSLELGMAPQNSDEVLGHQ